MTRKREITLKSPREIALMREAGRIVGQTLEILAQKVQPGMRTKDLDAIAEQEITSRGGTPSFKGYLGFPATICVSLNEQIVHGIPGDQVINDGDLVSIDCGAIWQGFQGDAAITLGVGAITAQAQHLIRVSRESLAIGIASARPGARIGDISAAVQAYIEAEGFGVVREYVGHGIGREMHEAPPVPNFGTPGRGLLLKKGLALAIEPMVTAGDWHTKVGSDNWTVSTLDGSLSAHFEHSIAITDEEPQILTLP